MPEILEDLALYDELYGSNTMQIDVMRMYFWTKTNLEQNIFEQFSPFIFNHYIPMSLKNKSKKVCSQFVGGEVGKCLNPRKILQKNIHVFVCMYNYSATDWQFGSRLT